MGTAVHVGLPSNPLVGFAREALPPVGLFVVLVAGWQGLAVVLQIPHYILPKPTEIVAVLGDEKGVLLAGAMWITFLEAICGFLLAGVVGLLAAVVMTQNRLLERCLYPYAIMLQTIPIVAVAPIIVIYIGTDLVTLGIGPLTIGVVTKPVVVISFIIALFPIISNSTAGLISTDHNLVTMFELYNAGWWQRMWKLKLPAALPYIMTGFRISAGLAVIGAIVGEFIAGIGGSRGGLGYLIVSAANRLEMAYLFAAALASSLLGIIIFVAVSQVSSRCLRHWHESAVPREA